MSSSGAAARKIAAATKRFSRPLLPEIAAKRLQKIRAIRLSQSIDGLHLLDLVPAISEDRERPTWLAPLAEIFERAAEQGGVRAVGATPPQHGKTELVEHGLVRLALKRPGLRHGYVTYSAERSEYVSRHFQRIAERAGLEPSGRLSDVTLKGGTEVRFTSVGGSFTGFSVDGLLVIDDPISDRVDAESSTIRRQILDWFTDVARTRRHASTSILVLATRWHPEDLSGELIQRGFPYTNLKAIAEGALNADGRVAADPLLRLPGESLWSAKPPGFFAEEQQDSYTWESLYQGEPRGRGATAFRWPDAADPTAWFDEPPSDLRISIGCDFAYTAKTHADYSVAVVLGQKGGTWYVLDVLRAQEEPRVFREQLRALYSSYPTATATAYVAATEQGGVEFVRDADIPIRGLSAAKAGDKFTRSLDVRAAWNTGHVLLPAKAPWRDAFLAEVCGFTGVKDRHDDQVDALAAAFDGLGYGDSEAKLIRIRSSRR